MINQSTVNFVKIYLVIMSILVAILFRYDIVSVDVGGAYRLDNWTGSMNFVAGSGPMEEVDNEATK